MVSQLRVSQIILEATFDLTQTFMRLSLGSCGGFFFPHLQGLMCLNSRTHENSKETTRLGVEYPPFFSRAPIDSVVSSDCLEVVDARLGLYLRVPDR